MLDTIKVGHVKDFSNFMNAVIDQKSFNISMSYINHARKYNDTEIIYGGKGDDRTGYFIYPTIIQTSNPCYKTMVEEIFGPVLTVYVYSENKYMETLDLCDKTSPYALTGAVLIRTD